MRITVTLLDAYCACDDGIEAFREAFPRGLTIATTEQGRKAQAARAASLDIDWAAENLLGFLGRAEYREAVEQASIAYSEAIEPASITYSEATAAPRGVYEADVSAAWTAYSEATAAPRGVYEADVSAAWVVYSEAKAAALAAYQRATEADQAASWEITAPALTAFQEAKAIALLDALHTMENLK